jgi:hypothetical protein
LRHGGVATRQFLNVVGQSQIPVGTDQGFLGLLQMVYRLVDLINGSLKTLRSKFVVFTEGSFE